MSASTSMGKRLQSGWECESSAAKKARGPRQTSVALLADKAISDNCRSVGPDELDHIFVGGLSLRQRVHRDKQMKEDKDPCAPTIGKRYWRDIRNMYLNPRADREAAGA